MSTTDKDVADRVGVLFNTKASGFQPPRLESKYAWHVRKSGPRALGWMLTLYPLLSGRRQAQVRAVLATCPASRKFKINSK